MAKSSDDTRTRSADTVSLDIRETCLIVFAGNSGMACLPLSCPEMPRRYIMRDITHLADLITVHAPSDGVHLTPIGGLTLVRNSRPETPIYTVHQPMLCIIAQGGKQVTSGSDTHRYDPSNYLIVSVAVPVSARITLADSDEPYLCFRLALEPLELAEMAAKLPHRPSPARVEPAMTVRSTTPELIDAVVRLVELLGRPDDLPVLAPLAKREIYHRLLTGPEASAVRRSVVPDGDLYRIAKVTAWIKDHFNEPLNAARLIGISNLSRSAFYKHFKAVTAMSPLEYQKQVRLQVARRRMVAEGIEASVAGYAVGYASIPQFTREYRRLFGRSPAKDASLLRAAADL